MLTSNFHPRTCKYEWIVRDSVSRKFRLKLSCLIFFTLDNSSFFTVPSSKSGWKQSTNFHPSFHLDNKAVTKLLNSELPSTEGLKLKFDKMVKEEWGDGAKGTRSPGLGNVKWSEHHQNSSCNNIRIMRRISISRDHRGIPFNSSRPRFLWHSFQTSRSPFVWPHLQRRRWIINKIRIFHTNYSHLGGREDRRGGRQTRS